MFIEEKKVRLDRIGEIPFSCGRRKGGIFLLRPDSYLYDCDKKKREVLKASRLMEKEQVGIKLAVWHAWHTHENI